MFTDGTKPHRPSHEHVHHVWIEVCCKNGHSLKLSDKNSGWSCDARREPGGCKCNNHVAGQPRYRCDQCDFDYCGECYDGKVTEKKDKKAGTKPKCNDLPEVSGIL
jgi:hypothetical protein